MTSVSADGSVTVPSPKFQRNKTGPVESATVATSKVCSCPTGAGCEGAIVIWSAAAGFEREEPCEREPHRGKTQGHAAAAPPFRCRRRRDWRRPKSAAKTSDRAPPRAERRGKLQLHPPASPATGALPELPAAITLPPLPFGSATSSYDRNFTAGPTRATGPRRRARFRRRVGPPAEPPPASGVATAPSTVGPVEKRAVTAPAMGLPTRSFRPPAGTTTSYVVLAVRGCFAPNEIALNEDLLNTPSTAAPPFFRTMRLVVFTVPRSMSSEKKTVMRVVSGCFVSPSLG